MHDVISPTQLFVGDFIKFHGLVCGDFVKVYKDNQSTKYVSGIQCNKFGLKIERI